MDGSVTDAKIVWVINDTKYIDSVLSTRDINIRSCAGDIYLNHLTGYKNLLFYKATDKLLIQ